jgi:hypothetical protein
MVKAITSKCLIVVLAELLESLEYFIFVCDDAEVNRRETLQSKEDFITKRTRLNPSCVLEAGFVSLETLGEGVRVIILPLLLILPLYWV